ncbi:MAG: MBOAT family protein [Caulobacter sp.]|nr:MBOAT family protein [Caulobacter sp.]
MLFNSEVFLFAFLPVTAAIYYLLWRKVGRQISLLFLLVASLGFYSYWNPWNTAIFATSVTVNFWLGALIGQAEPARRRWLVTAAVVFDLALLGVFKYWNFLAGQVGEIGIALPLVGMALPIGISFYTFQQIGYVVDTGRSGKPASRFDHYFLYLAFFPHSIAGPIVQHKELISQFNRVRPRIAYNLKLGLSIFTVGLAKKVLLADLFSKGSSPVFDAVARGHVPTLLEAWGAVLCYALQIYFDFSGYSDMAVGLARIFGYKFPINFFSPYKSRSIIEFWRRWHISLSRFLRNYLYFPLGGSKKGVFRRYLNVFIVMVLGGLWHGAGWTFLVWGALHGGAILINHLWNDFGPRRRWASLAGREIKWLTTFIFVLIAWTAFRAADLDAMVSMYRGMLGLNGLSLPLEAWPLEGVLRRLGVGAGAWNGVGVLDAWLAFIIAPITVLVLKYWPETILLFRRNSTFIVEDGYEHDDRSRLGWRPTWGWALIIGALLAITIWRISGESEFIYFQF